MIHVRLPVAGCALDISMRRLGVPPRNLLDLEMRGEEATERTWAILIEKRAGSLSQQAPAWERSVDGTRFLGESFAVTFGDRSALAEYDPALPSAGMLATQIAAFGALRREGRADLHVAAVIPPGSDEALILVGESGHGKSTLTLLAISLGWSFLSDDVVACFIDEGDRLSLAPLRRTLRVSEGALPLLDPFFLDGPWNKDTPPKLIVDPERREVSGRRLRARPGKLVFLERGTSFQVTPLSSSQAYEGLLRHSPQITADPDAKTAIAVLGSLAREAPAVAATLPLDSLYDAATLKAFLA